MAVDDVTYPRMGEARWTWWRSEILQAMFWLKGEGYGDEADATLLEPFLGVHSRIEVRHLERLLEEGYVERVGDRYKLSEAGAGKGGLQLAAWMEELMTPKYAQCGSASCVRTSAAQPDSPGLVVP